MLFELLPYGPLVAEHCILSAGLDPARPPAAAPLSAEEQRALLGGVRSWERWLDECESRPPEGIIYVRPGAAEGEGARARRQLAFWAGCQLALWQAVRGLWGGARGGAPPGALVLPLLAPASGGGFRRPGHRLDSPAGGAASGGVPDISRIHRHHGCNSTPCGGPHPISPHPPRVPKDLSLPAPLPGQAPRRRMRTLSRCALRSTRSASRSRPSPPLTRRWMSSLARWVGERVDECEYLEKGGGSPDDFMQ